jgi:hypothetical protein
VFRTPRPANAYLISSHSYSAFSAAVDPNRTTEMTIATIGREIQASE